MPGPALPFLAATWLGLGVVIVVAALRTRRSRRALQVGRSALAVLFVLAGAAVNAAFLATGADYTAFADASYSSFVRDTWRSVVAPNQGVFIGLLIAFEATAGLLVLRGGRHAEVGMVAMLAFHVGLLSFGWGFWLWSVPMLFALTLLLRAQRREWRTDRVGTRDTGRDGRPHPPRRRRPVAA